MSIHNPNKFRGHFFPRRTLPSSLSFITRPSFENRIYNARRISQMDDLILSVFLTLNQTIFLKKVKIDSYFLKNAFLYCEFTGNTPIFKLDLF